MQAFAGGGIKGPGKEGQGPPHKAGEGLLVTPPSPSSSVTQKSNQAGPTKSAKKLKESAIGSSHQGPHGEGLAHRERESGGPLPAEGWIPKNESVS